MGINILVMFLAFTLIIFQDINGINVKENKRITKRDVLSSNPSVQNNGTQIQTQIATPKIINAAPEQKAKVVTKPNVQLQTPVQARNTQAVPSTATYTPAPISHALKEDTTIKHDEIISPNPRKSDKRVIDVHPTAHSAFYECVDGPDNSSKKQPDKKPSSKNKEGFVFYEETDTAKFKKKQEAPVSSKASEGKNPAIIQIVRESRPQQKAADVTHTIEESHSIEATHEINPFHADHVHEETVSNHTCDKSVSDIHLSHNDSDSHFVPPANDILHPISVNCSAKPHQDTIILKSSKNVQEHDASLSTNNVHQEHHVDDTDNVEVDQVVIRNHDIDEFIERCKYPSVNQNTRNHNTRENGNQGNQYNNQHYASNYGQGYGAISPQQYRSYDTGQIQYYPTVETFPITDSRQTECSSTNYRPDFQDLAPYKYPFENDLKDYVAPLTRIEAYSEYKQPYARVETIEVDSQKLVNDYNNKDNYNAWYNKRGNGWYNKNTRPKQPSYYNGRYNFNLNPPPNYSYNEVVVPNRYKDRIWRTWRKTEVVIKGKNRTQPFQIELNRGNLYGNNASPVKYNRRNPLICFNGKNGNKNTPPFSMRYTN